MVRTKVSDGVRVDKAQGQRKLPYIRYSLGLSLALEYRGVSDCEERDGRRRQQP